MSGIKMPSTYQKRGRPKGHELTVIGLPSKKKKSLKTLQPFTKLHTSVKEKVMLEWFVDADLAADVLKNSQQLLSERDVEDRPEMVTDAVLDENVDIHLIRKYFQHDAWLLVTQYCSHDLDDESQAILCNHCLQWFHMKCVGLKQKPKKKYWFCRHCHHARVM
ncbi:uncharacterized protein LOC134197649 [Corticium candelabrum]|uniref:uncharacterized protein LOC134197649 n=1 Tax=Corticium candelabrum TaxID=121492 RepID=UPI002E265EA9|nr:uncharacterized protein LOC134197649 [Corticium candelabrum]